MNRPKNEINVVYLEIELTFCPDFLVGPRCTFQSPPNQRDLPENKIKILTLLLAPKDLTVGVSKRLAIVTSLGVEIQVPKT